MLGELCTWCIATCYRWSCLFAINFEMGSQFKIVRVATGKKNVVTVTQNVTMPKYTFLSCISAALH